MFCLIHDTVEALCTKFSNEERNMSRLNKFRLTELSHKEGQALKAQPKKGQTDSYHPAS